MNGTFNVHRRLETIEAALCTEQSQRSVNAAPVPQVSSMSGHEVPDGAPTKQRRKSQGTSPSAIWFKFWTTELRIWLMSGQ